MLLQTTWQCLNGDVIHAEGVCDSQIHCADSSDEAPLLCKGGQNSFLSGLNYFFIATVVLGFASYLCSLILTSMSFITLEITDATKDVHLSTEIQESFKAMKKVFSTIDTQMENEHGLNSTNKMTPENVSSIKTVYRKYHDKGSAHQKVFFETIHDFSMHPSYEEPCFTLVDSIAKEEEDIHQNDQNRPNCVEKFLKINMEIATYYFDVFDRNGPFSRLKREIVCIPKSIFGKKFSDVVFYASILTTITLSIKSIVTHYLDLAFDMKVYSALKHVADNFIGDKEKFIRLSSLPIHEISYAYLLFGLFSHLSYYIIYAMDFKRIFTMQDSRMRKFLFTLSICFPLHFVTLELAKTFVLQLNLRNNFRIGLNSPMKSEADIENAAENYVTYRLKLTKNTNRMITVRNTLIKMLIIEILIENLPQLLIVITFMISELTSGHGKLLMIVKDGLVEYFGGSLTILCLVIIFIQLNKFGVSLLTIQSRSDFPFSNGMIGTIMIATSITLMIAAKIVLIATALSHAIVFYPAWMILEGVIAMLYCKIMRIRLGMMDTILPCMILPTFICIRNQDYRPRMAKRKLKLISIVTLHFLNLFFAYAPIYALTQLSKSFDAFQSVFSMRTHIISVLTYLSSVGFYLLFDWIFKKYGNLWRLLLETPHDVNPSLNIETNKTADTKTSNDNNDP